MGFSDVSPTPPLTPLLAPPVAPRRAAVTLEEGKALARLFNKYATVEEPKKVGRDSRFDSKALQRGRVRGSGQGRGGARAAGDAPSRGRGQLKRRKSIDMTSFAQKMGQTLGSEEHVELGESEIGARGQISRENFQKLIQLQFGNAAKVLSPRVVALSSARAFNSAPSAPGVYWPKADLVYVAAANR